MTYKRIITALEQVNSKGTVNVTTTALLVKRTIIIA
jgi:hypothetical protein